MDGALRRRINNGCENTSGEAKAIAEKNCFEAILQLWQHRADLPKGKRPFEEIEPIARTLKSLDPENLVPRYFRHERSNTDEMTGNSDLARCLNIVEGLDYSTKILIGHFLAEAAGAASDKSDEWAKLAEAANVEYDIHRVIANLGSESNSSAETQGKLLDKMERLDRFIEIATAVSAQLKQRAG